MQNASMTFVLTGPDPLIFGLWKTLDANGFRIGGLGAPIDNDDAVTKGYGEQNYFPISGTPGTTFDDLVDLAQSAGQQAVDARDAAIQAMATKAEKATTVTGDGGAYVNNGGNGSLGGNVKVGVPIYGTRTLATAATMPTGAAALRLNGSAASGDGGAALYSEVGSAPSHAGYVADAAGRFFELVERRVTPAMFKTAANSWADAFNAAAVFLGLKGGGVLDLDGRAYTFTAPLVVDGSYIEIDATGSRPTFTHNAGPCLTLGNGATQRALIFIRGGRWVQDNACLQYLFDIRNVRNFHTRDIQTQGIYSYARWGRTDDAGPCYIWNEDGCEITLRDPSQATGHANAYEVTNSIGGWYQNNMVIEGKEGTANDAFRTTYAVRFANFVPTRFDHWMAANTLYKGFTWGIFADAARLVNLQWPSMRVDDCRNTPFLLPNIGGMQGAIWAGGTTAQVGSCVKFAPGTGQSVEEIDIRVKAGRCTDNIVELSTSGTGTISGVTLNITDPDWRPTSAGACALQANGAGGAVDLVTVSATVKRTGGVTVNNGIAKFGTTTNFVKGALNIVGATAVANF